MPDFTDLISQAKKMQEKMKETQENLKKIEVDRYDVLGLDKCPLK